MKKNYLIFHQCNAQIEKIGNSLLNEIKEMQIKDKHRVVSFISNERLVQQN